jgi:hypothetical protein
MKRRVLVGMLLLIAASAFAQTVDLTGEWTVYRVTGLSNYTLTEHLSGTTTSVGLGNTLALNADGSVGTDLPNASYQTWQMEEGFLMISGLQGNEFFMPRQLADTVYFLVRVDVMERNAQVVNITPRPQDNLIVVR